MSVPNSPFKPPPSSQAGSKVPGSRQPVFAIVTVIRLSLRAAADAACGERLTTPLKSIPRPPLPRLYRTQMVTPLLAIPPAMRNTGLSRGAIQHLNVDLPKARKHRPAVDYRRGGVP